MMHALRFILNTNRKILDLLHHDNKEPQKTERIERTQGSKNDSIEFIFHKKIWSCPVRLL